MDNIKHYEATSLDDAVSILAKGKGAVCAGGSDLMTYLKGFIVADPPTNIVDIKRISGLSYIKKDGDTLKIGALTTLYEIANSDDVKNNCPALAEAAGLVASPEIRFQGTIGGNICQKPRCIYYRNEFDDYPCKRKGESSMCYAVAGVNRYHSIFGLKDTCMAVCPSDTAPVLVAVGAKIVTTKKTWDAKDFFVIKGEQINSIDADEIVKEIQVPAAKKSVYKKFAFRKSIDFPLVSVAVAQTGSSAKVILGACFNEPYEIDAAEIAGGNFSEANAEAIAAKVDAKAKTTAQNKYKVQIAKTLIKRAILSLA
jgi:xanthine dehydrogenase YagS FAD-binding subunit